MPIYSHSQLNMYEQCPLKYKLRYRDKIRRDTEGVEAFVGSMVHDTLKKCYDDAKLTKLNPLDNLLSYYDRIWQKNWHDGIVITKQDLTPEHYKALGQKMIETYYRRYSPFDSDITVATEMPLNFSLEDGDRYRMTGYIDRLARTPDGAYSIHDYKTSSHLPGQQEADSDRQLALYHIGVQKKWPHATDIRLIWHYLAFDTELVSHRTPEAVAGLTQDLKELIDRIESADRFPPNESRLCEWCEYPDLCPVRKHFFKVEALPVNEYLNEPGVVLVNRYVALRDKAKDIGAELDKVREALLGYAQREGVELIKGSDHKARVRFDDKLKFPGKNDAEREELDELIQQSGKWLEVSALDTTSLTRAVEDELWSRDLIEKVMEFGSIERGSSVHVSKLKEGEDDL